MRNSKDPKDYYTFIDWGINPIEGDEPNTWFTLSQAEWKYVLSGRPNARNLYGIAYIDTIFGLVLVPDTWEVPEGIRFMPFGTGTNRYSIEQWKAMEENGAIFLPTLERKTSGGYYWTTSSPSTVTTPGGLIHILTIKGCGINPDYYCGGISRHYTRPVRGINHVPTGETIPTDKNRVTDKYIRDGQVVIRYQSKTFTSTGIEIQD